MECFLQKGTLSCSLKYVYCNKLTTITRSNRDSDFEKIGNNSTSKKYAVQREKVEQAIKGLCYGYPNGGIDKQLPGTNQYIGPNCGDVQLNGRLFPTFSESLLC